jgi:hypothetical protein
MIPAFEQRKTVHALRLAANVTGGFDIRQCTYTFILIEVLMFYNMSLNCFLLLWWRWIAQGEFSCVAEVSQPNAKSGQHTC